jgi:PhzF family phenazine biosynthesis protein
MTHPDTLTIERVAAFSDGETGGNPAGVVIADALPSESEMQRIAAEVGYSETAFAAPEGNAWRVRYFAPTVEVAFCGHATIALATRLAEHKGPGTYALTLNDSKITVESRQINGRAQASLTSPPTRSAAADPALVSAALDLFGVQASDLAEGFPPGLAHAGNDHLVLALKSRDLLAAITYDLEAGAALMAQHGLTTINLLFIETPRLFHSRNAFAIGGGLEDPATGAAAAALGGYLRDLGWPHEGSIDIIQGEDMGARSLLRVDIPAPKGSGIRVSGTARTL